MRASIFGMSPDERAG